ncbi:MAG: creatininase family protein [Planctomycetes bacterium]|nr:creatininase family protein [Planctomycetota bacterium]
MADSISRRGFFRSFRTMAAGAAGASVAAGLGVPEAEAKTPGALPIDSKPLSNGAGPYVHPDKVLLWERTRREMRESLASGQLKAAILPTGSVEQHNEHMAMVADVAISTLISQQVALALYPHVIVAPPSPCGFAPYHMARKGSVTLKKTTFLAYVYDVLESLKAHGIKTLLVLNGHGGNHSPLKGAEKGWREDLGVNLECDSYFAGIPREFIQEVTDSPQLTSHAGEFETSIYLAAFPQRVRKIGMQQYDDAKLNYESGFSDLVKPFLTRDTRTTPERLVDENKRDRRRQEESALASAEKGEKLISKATETFANRLRRMIAATEAGKTWPLPESEK